MRRLFSAVMGIWVLMPISMQDAHVQKRSTDRVCASRPLGIRLTASVERIRYCEGDNDVYTAQLRLSLRYTNRGPDRMIIYKALKPIDITSGAVGNSAKALQENKYETTLQYGQFIEPPTIPDSESPGPKFAIIPPGSSYGLEAQVAVPVRFKPSPSLSGTIAHGTHVMSVQVADWPFTPDSGKQLQARWTNFGILNYGAMGSEPFEFTIPSAPNLQDCSEHQSQL